jgi:hypothetical protein
MNVEFVLVTEMGPKSRPHLAAQLAERIRTAEERVLQLHPETALSQ